jgi:hypothetical protein
MSLAATRGAPAAPAVEIRRQSAIAVVATSRCCYPRELGAVSHSGNNRRPAWPALVLAKGGCAVSEVAKEFRQRRFFDLSDRDKRDILKLMAWLPSRLTAGASSRAPGWPASRPF